MLLKKKKQITFSCAMLDTITGSCAGPASTCSRLTTQKLANRTKDRPEQQLKSEK
jgi:hypothetical protein